MADIFNDIISTTTTTTAAATENEVKQQVKVYKEKVKKRWRQLKKCFRNETEFLHLKALRNEKVFPFKCQQQL